MRHLISPLDFTVEELDKLLNLAGDIGKRILKNTKSVAKERNLPLFFMSLAQEQD